MPILVKCGDPECAKTIRVKDELAGKAINCPACQKSIRVPAASPADAAKPSDPPAPKRSSSTPAEQPTDAAPLLSIPRLILRPKRGLKGIFSTDLDILDAESREPVGVAGDRTKKLLGLFKVNPDLEQWEILDADGGKVLFAIRITKERGFVTGDVDGIDCEFLDRQERVLGGFRSKLKGVVMKGWRLSLVNEDGEETGRVSISEGKVMAGEAPRITLSTPDGRELGSLTHKGIADVMAMMKQKKAEGKKFGMVSQVGEPGLEVTVADDSVGEVSVHRALLALAVIVEVTKIGKSQVSLSRH